MGKPTGFLEYARQEPERRAVDERLRDWRELEGHLPVLQAREQGARCMNCGIPFCHTGCPLGNVIPDWNDHVYKDRWESAIASLHATNNFPEVTGRVCPAPCEEACVLNINDRPVTIKQIEHEIADRALSENWVVPQPPETKTGKSVGVIGSGPAGLAAAQQLARAGHDVVVYERDDRIGGLLRYGIPDFKMEKHLIDRRIAQMQAEGVVFRTSVEVGVTLSIDELRAKHDALIVATGATVGRDLDVPGRELRGVHFAMEFLPQQNRVVAGDAVPDQILATGKKVVILGGGDTGSDCLGTSLRQGAQSVLSIELLPRPPEDRRHAEQPWPLWPMILRTSSSHEEGGEREFAILTKAFEGEDGVLKRIRAVRLEWTRGENGALRMTEVPGSEFTIEADLCLLAMGFTGPEQGLLERLGVSRTARGNADADDERFATSAEGVFACGDARRGQSLVVWAIWEGREAARAVDAYLLGATRLPSTPRNAA